MRLFILSIICGAILISGCASQIPTTPVKGVTDECFQGTWKSTPENKRLTAKIIFLPDQHCRVSFIKGSKTIYDNSSCSYKLTHSSAMLAIIDHPKEPQISVSINTTQVTPINNGKLLDYRLLKTIRKYKSGKQKVINAWPPYGTPIDPHKKLNGGDYTLHRVTSLKDIFSNLLSKL